MGYSLHNKSDQSVTVLELINADELMDHQGFEESFALLPGAKKDVVLAESWEKVCLIIYY